MWNWISHHKSQSKKANLLTPGERNSAFPSEECQRFFLPRQSASNNSLFSCPIHHQCPTYFLSLCGLKLFSFYLRKIFHTPHGMLGCQRGTFGKSRNGIIAGCAKALSLERKFQNSAWNFSFLKIPQFYSKIRSSFNHDMWPNPKTNPLQFLIPFSMCSDMKLNPLRMKSGIKMYFKRWTGRGQ